MNSLKIDEIVLGLSKKKTAIVVCPYCKGSGQTESKLWEGHVYGWSHITSECGVCAGQKVLSREVSIEYKRV